MYSFFAYQLNNTRYTQTNQKNKKTNMFNRNSKFYYFGGGRLWFY